MTTEKSASPNVPLATLIPAIAVEDDSAKAGPGQKAVVSPAGTRSVVEEDAVALLKTQGYKEA